MNGTTCYVVHTVRCQPMENFAGQQTSKEKEEEITKLIMEDGHGQQSVHYGNPQSVLHVFELNVS